MTTKKTAAAKPTTVAATEALKFDLPNAEFIVKAQEKMQKAVDEAKQEKAQEIMRKLQRWTSMANQCVERLVDLDNAKSLVAVEAVSTKFDER